MMISIRLKDWSLEEVPTNKNAIAGVVTELVTAILCLRHLYNLLDENNIKLKEVDDRR